MTEKIQKFFENQKDYIFCKKGCSKCCKKAQFPYSEIEFKLIFEGLKNLDTETQNVVLNKIDKIIQDKQAHNEKCSDKKFLYDCPFLINDNCSVYYYRGLICRTFGLMTFVPENEMNPKIPFCAFEGLNYSNVLDKNNNTISDKKYTELAVVQQPMAYNLEYATITSEKCAKEFGFQFGEIKPLIEWFIKWKEFVIENIENQ